MSAAERVTSARTGDQVQAIQGAHGIVGREDELALALAVLGAGRHLLLEGPVGVGKTTVALAVCDHLGRATIRVDGDDRYSEARLTGWFDPPLVLERGYGEASFISGPLVDAMRRGAVLFINELNRMPETVQNVLLPALDERRIGVPHLGEVVAAPGFLVVATQNPVEYVATGHLSEALRDRFEHLELAYQPEAEEVSIVEGELPGADPELVGLAVRIARATREHPSVRKGASVRGAIATAALATRLAAETPGTRPTDPVVLRRAAAAALRTRIDVRDDAGAGFAAVLDEVIERARAATPPSSGGPERETDAEAGGEEPPAALLAVLPRRTDPDERLREDGRLDGWRIAARLSTGRLEGAQPEIRDRAHALAAAAVLRRAAALVGPLRAATRLERGPQGEGHDGELDLEATLENWAGRRHPDPADLVVERRVEQRRQVVLALDTSGSMAGENMALAAVATAVLARKLHPGDLGVVAFSDDARVLVPLGEPLAEVEIVRRLLDRPCRGATNVAAALAQAEAELGRGRNPRRSAVLVTDGMATAGSDPRPIAAGFRALHVLHTKPAAHAVLPSTVWISPRFEVAADIARLGHGRLVPVATFADLPRRMLDLAGAVLR